MRLGPKAKHIRAYRGDSNREPFNFLCYVLSHCPHIPTRKIREVMYEK